MSLRSEYSLGHSEFNAFLFAVVGEAESGQELTVLSALSRLGLDPWREAARLSKLPKDAAANSLAATLNTLPGEDLAMLPDKRSTALRLVDCLPRHSLPADKPPQDSSIGAGVRVRKWGANKWLVAAGLCIVAICTVLWLYSNKVSEFETRNTLLIQPHQAGAAVVQTDRQRPAGLRDVRPVEGGPQRQAVQRLDIDRAFAVNDLARARVRLGGHLSARGRG